MILKRRERNKKSGKGAVADVKPVIRRRDDHNVSRKEMNPNAVKVLYRLQRNGYTAYLVGGGVRDLLLGRSPKDFDIATDARPRQIRKLFRNAYLIGRRFRLVHIKFGDDVIETSTFRRDPEPSESDQDSLYQQFDNTFGTPVEDALRRDFTINAMFYDVKTFSIIDYVGGLKDLERGLVRCIGAPDLRFREDPVRMIRAIRFAARLDFKIESTTYAAIGRHYREISLAAPARMLEEVVKLFSYGAGCRAFELLKKTGLLAVLLPELDDALEDASLASVFWGSMKALDAASCESRENPSQSMAFALLTFPAFLKALGDAEKEGNAPDHMGCAHEVVDCVALRYRMPKRVAYRIVQMFASQRRFEGVGARFSKIRFVRHDFFPDALCLRRLHLKALGESDRSLKEWETLLDADPNDDEENDAPPTRDGKGARPRRRRRRRPDSRSTRLSLNAVATA